jgi:hypothetical protein
VRSLYIKTQRIGLGCQIGLILVSLVSCNYINNKIERCCDLDEKMTREGKVLKCTEFIGNECVTHQWFNQIGE